MRIVSNTAILSSTFDAPISHYIAFTFRPLRAVELKKSTHLKVQMYIKSMVSQFSICSSQLYFKMSKNVGGINVIEKNNTTHTRKEKPEFGKQERTTRLY